MLYWYYVSSTWNVKKEGQIEHGSRKVALKKASLIRVRNFSVAWIFISSFIKFDSFFFQDLSLVYFHDYIPNDCFCSFIIKSWLVSFIVNKMHVEDKFFEKHFLPLSNLACNKFLIVLKGTVSTSSSREFENMYVLWSIALSNKFC